MKKFIHKVQELGRKADELKSVVQSIPGKAAELRQAVTLSAGELHQIRGEVQADLSALRAGNEDRLLQAMKEINDGTNTFEEAGYELAQIELDLGLVQRLAVHLQKFKNVSIASLRALAESEKNETIKSILSALIKAEEMSANVHLTHLRYGGVMVHIGPTPLVRLCWSNETLQEDAPAKSVGEPTIAAPAGSSTSPAFGSFFEQQKREPRAVTPNAVSEIESTNPAPGEPSSESAHPSAQQPKKEIARWSRDSLDRFKQMPRTSKYSR